MLERDQVDLALIYDYNLAPATLDASLEVIPLWESSWSLAVPSPAAPAVRRSTSSPPSPPATGS